MILIITLSVIATSIVVLSFSYQALIFHRSFAWGRGWIRIIAHNMGISLLAALAGTCTLLFFDDLSRYWYLSLYPICAHVLGDLPLVIVKERKRRRQDRHNHDIIRKLSNG